jgi:hypothetical protein
MASHDPFPMDKKRKGSSEAIKRRRTENPNGQKRERGHQRPQREGQTTQWTKEKGLIRGHKEKALSLLSIGLSVILIFMTSYDPSLFCSLGCLSFFSF